MRVLLASTLLSATLAAAPVSGCELALLFAVDVSGSVDSREYRVQMQGLAEGLRDVVVREALVRGEANLALMQWSGASRQVLSVDWTRIGNEEDLEALADRIATVPREWTEYSTAIGQALTFAMGVVDAAPACRRRVIDISSDGRNNEGHEPLPLRDELRSLAITVNALVIRGDDDGLPDYFSENVVTGGNSFVVTAEDYDEYPERMRRKLRRETERQISKAPGEGAIPVLYRQ